MDIMEALNEITEEEFLELAYIIYCMGQESKSVEHESSVKRRLRIRIEEWLEI